MRCTAFGLALFAFIAVVLAQPPADLAKRPIATANSPVGDLLRK